MPLDLLGLSVTIRASWRVSLRDSSVGLPLQSPLSAMRHGRHVHVAPVPKKSYIATMPISFRGLLLRIPSWAKLFCPKYGMRCAGPSLSLSLCLSVRCGGEGGREGGRRGKDVPCSKVAHSKVHMPVWHTKELYRNVSSLSVAGRAWHARDALVNAPSSLFQTRFDSITIFWPLNTSELAFVRSISVKRLLIFLEQMRNHWIEFGFFTYRVWTKTSL